MASGLIGKFSIVGAATLASRFLGFIREALIAALLGAGPVADAFYAAFRFPNLFRRLFAEGAFNSAFIPLFARELEGGGRQAARLFAEQILAALLLTLIALTALAMIAMPFLVNWVVAARFDPASEKFDLTVLLTRIMFPYLAAMSVVAMLSGILNSFRRYFVAAIAPLLLNAAMLASLLAAMALGLADREIGLALSWSVVIAGVLQLLLLFHGVKREGFPLALRRPGLTPAVRRLLLLAAPAAVTGGITQVNLLIGQNIASAREGAIATINYADRLFQLPLGVIAAAIGVVLLPELARALKAGDMAEAGNLQNKSLEFGMLLTLPCAAGMMILPEALLALLFERGAFTRETTLTAAQVLLHFSWGLPAATLIAIFRPGYYAREDMRTPMWFAAANVSVNIVLSLYLFPRAGVAGIAMATSAGQWTNALLLGATLWRRNLFRPAAMTLRNLALIFAAMLLAAGFLIAFELYFGNRLLDAGLIERVILIGLAIGLSAVIYFGFALATGAMAREQIGRLLARRSRAQELPR